LPTIKEIDIASNLKDDTDKVIKIIEKKAFKKLFDIKGSSLCNVTSVIVKDSDDKVIKASKLEKVIEFNKDGDI